MDNFIYRLGSITNHLGIPPSFYRSDNLLSSGCKFGSIYAVRESDAECIQKAGTAAGFRGIVWSRRLWLDLDTEETSTKAQAKIKEMGYDAVCYTTGNRGCHIGVLRDIEPSHCLPQQDKTWAQANIDGADLSLYWHLHLIRLPGILHEKTEQPKRLLWQQKGKILVLPKWKIPSDIRETEAAQSSDLGGIARNSIFKQWQITSNLIPNGHRRQLVELAIALKRDGKVTKEEALWVVREVNRGFDISKDDNDVVRIVDWTYSEDQ